MRKNILILFICLVILAFVWFKMDSFDKICESFTTIVPEDSTYKVFNNVFSKYFPKDPPARSAVVNELLVDVKVEVEVIAYKPEK